MDTILKLHSRYYYTRLSEENRRVYRQIYNTWCRGNCAASLFLPGTDFTAFQNVPLHDIAQSIIMDNPQLFHLEISLMHYERDGFTVKIYTDPVYTPAEYREIYRELIERVQKITSVSLQYEDFFHRTKLIHDYLAENVTYNLNAVSPRGELEKHTVVGALLNRSCVCDGYSRAFRLLCDRSKVSCIVAVGDSTALDNPGPHAWNIVKFRNQKYHIDVTWDRSSDKRGVSDVYFLRNDEMFMRDHRWIRDELPKCVGQYRLPYECRLQNSRDLRIALKHVLQRKGEKLLVRYTQGVDDENTVIAKIQQELKSIMIVSKVTYHCSFFHTQPYVEIWFHYGS